MERELIKYNEPLEEDELAFLKRKEHKEKTQFHKTFRLLMVMSFIIPFAGAWYQAAANAPNAFSPLRYFMVVVVLLALSSAGTWMAYRFSLRKVQWDLKERTKTIEINHIIRKQFMPQNNTYYFYVDSPNRLSIETSQTDFYNFKEGDEITLEYSTHAKVYLGYF